MIFNGTLTELTQLTSKHWKAKWWPKHIITPFDPCLYPSVAAEIIFARAVEWIMVKGAKHNRSMVLCSACNGRQFWINAGHKTSVSNDFRCSMLAAVLLTIEQINEDYGKGILECDWSETVGKTMEAPSTPA